MWGFKIGDIGHNTILGTLEVIAFDEKHGLIRCRRPYSASDGIIYSVEPDRFKRGSYEK